MGIPQITVLFDGVPYSEADFGEELNQQLLLVYDRFLNGLPFDDALFANSVKQMLNNYKGNYAAHDDYFEWFTPLWKRFMENTHFSAAESVWQFALRPVHEWEDTTGERVHKGTAYYFWAGTALLSADVDRAFLLMHRGLQEDVTTHNVQVPDTPGNAFVTLDFEKQDQAFRPLVQHKAEFLNQYISKYREGRLRTLTITDLREKFLSYADLRSAALVFVYLIHKVDTLQQTISLRLAESDFAGLMELDLLFGLCLVADSVIKHACGMQNPQFSDLALFLLQRLKSPLNQNQLQEKINGRVKSDFGQTISEVLNGSVCGINLSPIEIDVVLTYALRNRGAHNIEGHTSVFKNFEEIVQRVMNTIFVSIETLY